MENTQKKMSTKTMVFGAILTALVIVLQYISMAIRTSTFSITLSLIPIVIGALTCGVGMGAWLGLVFGAAVLWTGDAAPFWEFSPFATFMTVILKGVASGALPALVYNLFQKKHKVFATSFASIISPIANTGVFLIGCVLCFIPKVTELYGNITVFLVTIFGFNFAIELILNIIFAPTITRLLNIREKQN